MINLCQTNYICPDDIASKLWKGAKQYLQSTNLQPFLNQFRYAKNSLVHSSSRQRRGNIEETSRFHLCAYVLITSQRRDNGLSDNSTLRFKNSLELAAHLNAVSVQYVQVQLSIICVLVWCQYRGVCYHSFIVSLSISLSSFLLVSSDTFSR